MKVRIFRISKNTMQSGRGNLKNWRIEPELESARVPEPIMGWSSSEDTLNQIRLRFADFEAAERFALKQGWEVIPLEPHERIVTPRNYTDNFRPRRTEA